MIEQWKDIKGYEGYYQVSNTGKVRSLERIIKAYIKSQEYVTLKGRELKISLTTRRYPYVALTIDNKPKKYSVHRLMAEAFIPNPDNKPQVNHKDGNKLNFTDLNNLEWCTASENSQHAVNTGLLKCTVGDKNPKCKYTDEQIKEIFRLNQEGFSGVEISDKLLIPKTSVLRYLNNKVKSYVKIDTSKTIRTKGTCPTKISNKDMEYVIKSYINKEKSSQQLSKEFNVSRSTIYYTLKTKSQLYV